MLAAERAAKVAVGAEEAATAPAAGQALVAAEAAPAVDRREECRSPVGSVQAAVYRAPPGWVGYLWGAVKAWDREAHPPQAGPLR